MGRDRDSGVKQSGMAGFRRKKVGKAGFENPYCGPSRSTKFNLRCFRVLIEKYSTRKTSLFFFSLENLCGYFYRRTFSQRAKPGAQIGSCDIYGVKMAVFPFAKLLKFDNFFPPLRHFFPARMTLVHARALVLRKSRTRSCPRLRIQSSLN